MLDKKTALMYFVIWVGFSFAERVGKTNYMCGV